MNAIFEAALEIQDFCRSRLWRSCVIGGLAVQRWGEPRLTRDVDLTLLTGFGKEAVFVDALLVSFRSRLPDARDFALRNRVLLLASSGGVPLDVGLVFRELDPLLELKEDAESGPRLAKLLAGRI